MMETFDPVEIGRIACHPDVADLFLGKENGESTLHWLIDGDCLCAVHRHRTELWEAHVASLVKGKGAQHLKATAAWLKEHTGCRYLIGHIRADNGPALGMARKAGALELVRFGGLVMVGMEIL